MRDGCHLCGSDQAIGFKIHCATVRDWSTWRMGSVHSYLLHHIGQTFLYRKQDMIRQPL